MTQTLTVLYLTYVDERTYQDTDVCETVQVFHTAMMRELSGFGVRKHLASVRQAVRPVVVVVVFPKGNPSGKIENRKERAKYGVDLFDRASVDKWLAANMSSLFLATASFPSCALAPARSMPATEFAGGPLDRVIFALLHSLWY